MRFDNEIVEIVQHMKCASVDHLKSELSSIISKGGEGLVLRRPHSPYIFGRSQSLLKVRQQLDCEVKYLRNSRTGISFDCLLPNGQKRKVKCKQSEYSNPPVAGSVLTVRHFGILPNGGIKFPDFHRVRGDITWEDVLEDFRKTNTLS